MQISIQRMGEVELITAIGTPEELAEYTRKRETPAFRLDYNEGVILSEEAGTRFNQAMKDHAIKAYGKGGETK